VDVERWRELWVLDRELAAAATPSNFSDLQGNSLADANAKLQAYVTARLDPNGEKFLLLAERVHRFRAISRHI
jgi:hypothetical protein